MRKRREDLSSTEKAEYQRNLRGEVTFPGSYSWVRGRGSELFFASTEETGWQLGGVEATFFTRISLN